ncbi:MAG: hypothetical protein KatS3mg060_0793 [Dehalococcoidia bacterium]|nr:MAG: hypothetical protein KatS3mg060_0793 [Dehalococcoidia bacterium]
MGTLPIFPFDRHQARLVFDLADGLGENAQAVPFVVELRAAISGLTLLPSASLTDTGYLDLDIAIWRSNATIGFALLVMVIMWCLALGNVLRDAQHRLLRQAH